ncbi:hypothetical protein DFP72DRAFT_846964 [Ephemerocybe angulata]|uniref:Glutathione S-transferase UstS-like C-terminal domain-containing protein n=1 Tax=Ephemerocybe angulata TaxID=980116 RepID=A0A8H6I1G7_9AGAR|nr:hypothetical protein DFP72DRAFT_846964 [Tulosesus angulatus]
MGRRSKKTKAFRRSSVLSDSDAGFSDLALLNYPASPTSGMPIQMGPFVAPGWADQAHQVVATQTLASSTPLPMSPGPASHTMHAIRHPREATPLLSPLILFEREPIEQRPKEKKKKVKKEKARRSVETHHRKEADPRPSQSTSATPNAGPSQAYPSFSQRQPYYPYLAPAPYPGYYQPTIAPQSMPYYGAPQAYSFNAYTGYPAMREYPQHLRAAPRGYPPDHIMYGVDPERRSSSSQRVANRGQWKTSKAKGFKEKSLISTGCTRQVQADIGMKIEAGALGMTIEGPSGSPREDYRGVESATGWLQHLERQLLREGGDQNFGGPFTGGKKLTIADAALGGLIVYAGHTLGADSKEWKEIIKWKNRRWGSIHGGPLPYTTVHD